MGISYENLGLKFNTEVKKIAGTDIEVLQYLPVGEKYDLINITLQNAKVDGEFQSLLLDVFFHLYLVYMYTNIEFTDEQKAEPFKTYDILKTNGIINEVLLAIPGEEYDDIYHFLIEQLERDQEYALNISGLLSKVIDELPKQMEKMGEIVENFDPEKVNNVLNFVKSANNGQLPGQN